MKGELAMPLYRCSECGCVENTALGGYWMQGSKARDAGQEHKPLCSACDPEIGKWHGQFPQKQADGYVTDRRGFIYTPAEAETLPHMGPFTPIPA
jgi:hypothetical protein